MTLWPPNWYAIFGIVTFVLASLAVRGWRDLAVFVALITLLVFPLKWLGPAIGLAALAQDAVTWQVAPSGSWRLHAEPSAAFIASALLGALMMLAWKRVAATRQAESD
jgi:hypothetical protein